jgi:hypothetical protein
VGGTGSYTYQWQSSDDGLNWTAIAGENQESYSPPALVADKWYRLNVSSGDCGLESSNSVLIKVYPELVPGRIENNQTVCVNSRPSLADALPVTAWRWYDSNGNLPRHCWNGGAQG